MKHYLAGLIAVGLAALATGAASAQAPFEPDRRSAFVWPREYWDQPGALVDLDNARANAAVLVRSGNIACQGFLVRQDLVLTVDQACGVYRGQAGRQPGRWLGIHNQAPIEVLVGRDELQPLGVFMATHINLAGMTDLAFLALDRPVPAGWARPRGVITELPPSIEFYAGPRALERPIPMPDRRARWLGAGSPLFELTLRPSVQQLAANPPNSWREISRANRPDLGCRPDQPGLMCVQHPRDHGAQTGPRDAGAPLTFAQARDDVDGLAGLVVGHGLSEAGDLVIPTWLETRRNAAGLTQRDWLRDTLEISVCAAIKRSAQTGPNPHRLLAHWWSPSRGDNFTAADPAWSGCASDVRDGYHWVGDIGRVFNPNMRPADGLVPLHHWYSPTRGDNFLTTDPQWYGQRGDVRSPDYLHVGMVGYIYAPDRPAPAGAQPLWSWWSPSRGDNFATTDPAWSPASGGERRPDYRYYRLEGYLLPAEISLELD